MAKFIEQLTECVSNFFEKIAQKVRKLTNTIEDWIERICWYDTYTKQVLDSNPTYKPELVDIQLAEDIKSALQDIAPEGVVAYMQTMTPEERAEFIEETILPLITSKMSINCDGLEWVESDRLCGCYDHTRNVISVNVLFIASDNEMLLTILLNTIIHECKHARQHVAIDGADFGYSQQLLDEWRQNLNNYIVPEECDEAYQKQPVEVDASGFANSIINENRIFEN